jgi:hypothetical protein
VAEAEEAAAEAEDTEDAEDICVGLVYAWFGWLVAVFWYVSSFNFKT